MLSALRRGYAELADVEAQAVRARLLQQSAVTVSGLGYGRGLR
jgi:hypothetical protein